MTNAENQKQNIYDSEPREYTSKETNTPASKNYEIIGDSLRQCTPDNESRKQKTRADDIEKESNSGGAVNSGRFQALQNVDEEDSHERDISDKDSDDEEMNIDKIYWIAETELYAHASGMRYDMKTKNYFTWVTDDVEDRRCLYYFPFQGILKLIRTGRRGQLNNAVLKDMDWNRSRIYTEKSYGYRNDLHQLFRDQMANRL